MLRLWLVTLVVCLSLIYYQLNCFVPENLQPFEELYNQIKQAEIKVQKQINDITQPHQSHYKIKIGTNSYYFNNHRNEDYVKNFQSMHSQDPKENATILMLVRNWELSGALKSMRSLEDRFNHQYHYTWTFLNDVLFTEEFKEATSLMASGKTQYDLIPSKDWDRPDWINETKFEENLNNSEKNGVLYGNSKSYRNMCRFNSGYFYKQSILDNYKYYFRVEPNVEYFCDFQYDPFKLMRFLKKRYGFVISLYEYEDTIPTFWKSVEEFMEKYPEHLPANNSLKFITDTSPIGPEALAFDLHSNYNLCHFWSNFEIGDLDFFRSKAYNDYFNHLESTGGFYYERWGDAPVHSVAVALLLNSEEIHHFEDIGYSHAPFESCPSSQGIRFNKRCVCDPNHKSNIDISLHSCLPKWWKFGAGKTFLYQDE